MMGLKTKRRRTRGATSASDAKMSETEQTMPPLAKRARPMRALEREHHEKAPAVSSGPSASFSALHRWRLAPKAWRSVPTRKVRIPAYHRLNFDSISLSFDCSS